jgi:SNF2 family DNA or RNA helicase
MRKFLHDRSCRFLVANNHSGATTGINPQHVCRRIMFYDSPADPIVRAQAEKRVHRPGQERRVYIHDFMIAKSVDEIVLGFIKEGRSLFQAIVNGEEVPV